MKKTIISLSTPCSLPYATVIKDYNGKFCNHCKKEVIDYSNMTDGEMLNYIQKNGIGVCGAWREDQLDRPLNVNKKKKYGLKLLYAALISVAWLRPYESIAQSIPDTIQTPNKTIRPDKQKEEQNKINEDTIHPKKVIMKMFGTGNIATIRTHHQIPFTPFYVLSIKDWFKPGWVRNAAIIKIGQWYIPYISKR